MSTNYVNSQIVMAGTSPSHRDTPSFTLLHLSYFPHLLVLERVASALFLHPITKSQMSVALLMRVRYLCCTACPLLTCTFLVPSARVYRLTQVDVCDKVDVSPSDPSLDASYYSSFDYTLLDGSGVQMIFDSTPTKDPSGEVQVSEFEIHMFVKRVTATSLSGRRCLTYAPRPFFLQMA